MKTFPHLKFFILHSVFCLCLAARAAVPAVTTLGALSATLHGPAGVATDAAGNVYVTDPAAGSVTVFSAFGLPVARHDGFAGPLAVAVAGDGRIYVSEQQPGSVSVFDAQWNRLYQLGGGTNGFQLPAHLAVDPSSPATVYVSDGVANQVRVFTEATQTAAFGGAGTGQGQFDFPAGIAVRPNGEVLVVDQNNDRMEVFTNHVYARQFPLGSGGMFSGPTGRSTALSVDDAGRVYVTETMQGLVNVFDATGASLGSLGGFGTGNGQLNLPVGVGLDRWGRLFVASANNARVEMFGVDDFLQLSAQPSSGIATAGGTLTFSATSGGTNALQFQWRKDGVNLPGATNAMLTISNATAGDTGGYAVVITSAAGSATNRVGTVTVLVPPAILAGPQNQTVMLGATAMFSVAASGDALQYQWGFNGVNLAGATNAILSLAGVQAPQAGEYSVQINNGVGAVTAAATLSVLSPPLVMDVVGGAQPVGQPFQVSLNVDPGYAYTLAASTNLLEWQAIATITGANGLCDFMDADATNYPGRFYRLQWAP